MTEVTINRLLLLLALFFFNQKENRIKPMQINVTRQKLDHSLNDFRFLTSANLTEVIYIKLCSHLKSFRSSSYFQHSSSFTSFIKMCAYFKAVLNAVNERNMSSRKLIISYYPIYQSFSH